MIDVGNTFLVTQQPFEILSTTLMIHIPILKVVGNLLHHLDKHFHKKAFDISYLLGESVSESLWGAGLQALPLQKRWSVWTRVWNVRKSVFFFFWSKES